MRLVVALAMAGACSCLHAPGPVGRGNSPSLSVGKGSNMSNLGGSIKIQSGLRMPVPTRHGTVSSLRGGSGEATVASLTTGLIKNIVRARLIYSSLHPGGVFIGIACMSVGMCIHDKLPQSRCTASRSGISQAAQTKVPCPDPWHLSYLTGRIRRSRSLWGRCHILK